MKFYWVCRVRCKCCSDVLEHVNRTKTDSYPRMFSCSCGKVALDPAAIGYRIIGNPANFEDLSKEWE